MLSHLLPDGSPHGSLCDEKLDLVRNFKTTVFLFLLIHLLAAESYKETQMVKIKEEPMEVDVQDSHVSVSPSRNVGYSTLIGREKTEPLPKMPEGRVPPERNLFSQDISVKMASELLFQLSGTFLCRKMSIIGNNWKESHSDEGKNTCIIGFFRQKSIVFL